MASLSRFISGLSPEIRQYLIVTGNYWAFTLTDGALRMLVVLYFHGLGYSPLQIALLFLFYEFFGVITNLIGGWLGANLGLNKIMNAGLLLQIIAMGMLLVPTALLTIPWVMAAQALSGIAKDLNKMSAKSSIKLLVPEDAKGQLFKWVAILTGSKNALKGAGFFLGGLLLTLLEFQGAIVTMMAMLVLVWLFSLVSLKQELGKAKAKAKFRDIFSKSRAVNLLAAARLFLFASRDVWFVVALPVYLATELQWDHSFVGGFLALWVIGYGVIQGLAPSLTGSLSRRLSSANSSSNQPGGKTAAIWAFVLAGIPLGIALGMGFSSGLYAQWVLLIGLLIFGGVFAVNSSLHSFLIVNYARADGVSLDVGFYYMANAMGRLLGTIFSGWLYQVYGLIACLWFSALLVCLAALVSLWLPRSDNG